MPMRTWTAVSAFLKGNESEAACSKLDSKITVWVRNCFTRVSREMLDEITQEVKFRFFKMIRSDDKLKSKYAARQWIETTARNFHNSSCIDPAARPRTVSLDDNEAAIEQCVRRFYDEYDRECQEAAEHIRFIAERDLSSRERELLFLYAESDRGLTLRDIADLLKITHAAARQRWCSLVARIKELDQQDCEGTG